MPKNVSHFTLIVCSLLYWGVLLSDFMDSLKI